MTLGIAEWLDRHHIPFMWQHPQLNRCKRKHMRRFQRKWKRYQPPWSWWSYPSEAALSAAAKLIALPHTYLTTSALHD